MTNRGEIPIGNEFEDRPGEANERSRLGDFEADTLLGKIGKAALLTLPDRKSRFLFAGKLSKLGDKQVEETMIKVLQREEVKSITPDRGREFRRHVNITKPLGVEFYFSKSQHPWERGTNENTNGLLREYFPKGYDFDNLREEDLRAVVDQLNQRPRKCLGYRTTAEVYFSTMLHLA